MPPEAATPIGAIIGIAVYSLAGIGSLICLIMVLIPLFKEKGPGLGILGIFCGIFTYVWGWMNLKQHNLKKIMLAWTACIVIGIIGYIITFAAMAKAVSDNPEAFQTPPSAIGDPATGF